MTPTYPANPALPDLGYGAAALGNLYQPLDDATAAAIVETAWTAGIRHFDVAPHYGLGLAERRLGAGLKDKAREDYVLSTKVGRLLVPRTVRTGETDQANGFAVAADHERVWDSSADGLRRSLEESLRRLDTDHIDIAYLHDPEENVPAGRTLDSVLREALPALVQLRDEGLVDAVGVGSKSVTALLAAVTSADLDLIMLSGRFTLLDQSAATELLPACLERQVRVVAVSVFNSGALAEIRPRADLPFDYNAVSQDMFEQIQRLASICADHGTDLPTAALHFPLRHRAVDSVVVGAATPTQITQNIDRFRARVPDQFWTALADAGLVARTT